MRSENSADSPNTHMSTRLRDAGRQQVHCREVGWWARVERDHASVQGTGWGRQPCLRPTVHPVRGRVRRDGTRSTPLPTSNKKLSTGHEEEAIPAPIVFFTEHMRRLRCRRVDDSPSRARHEARMGSGHVRPSRPPPSLPSGAPPRGPIYRAMRRELVGTAQRR